MAVTTASKMAAGELAPSLFRRLNGVFCYYKPEGATMARARFNLRHKLAEELSALPWQQRKIVSVDTDSTVPIVTNVPDPAHSPLALGPRYQIEDFHITSAHNLSDFSSGVHLIGIGRGSRFLKFLNAGNMIRVYHVTGELGRATSDFTPNTRTLIKTSYRHVTREKFSRQLSAIQASHQRLMFDYAGVKVGSEEGYRLASRGLIRPLENSPPLIYNINCIKFTPPYFTLEVHCVNEICDFLKQLIDLIGRDLKSSAVCRKIHRIRVGHFGLEHSLLQKHCTAENIIQNIVLCQRLLETQNDVEPSNKLRTSNSDVTFPITDVTDEEE